MPLFVPGVGGSSLQSDGSSWVQSTSVTCTPTYSFLPCTTELWGQLFLIVVYNLLTSVGSSYVSKGSDLFFRMFGTGVLGAGVFQLLGMVPQTVIMLVSILPSDSDTVESMAAMIMAMLAGSTIFSLTIVWGSVILSGRRHISDSDSNLGYYGVMTDQSTKRVAAYLLFIPLIPILILQLAAILSSSTAKRWVILVALIVTIILLIAYIMFQVFKPLIQDRSYEYVVRKTMQRGLLQYLTSSGNPNEDPIRNLFHKIDKNGSSKISETELYAFILGIQIEEVGFSTDEFAQKVMDQFDTSQDKQISETEFMEGISQWLNVSEGGDHLPSSTRRRNRNRSQKNSDEHEYLISGNTLTPVTEPSVKLWWNYTLSVFMIVFGTGIMLVIGMPLMISVSSFASAVNIPSFLIAYVIIPLSMGYRQLIAAIHTASKGTVKDISLALSQVYNGVFMNNLVSFALFLVLVFVKDISWDVSSEVLMVLLICLGMGCISCLKTQFQIWIGVFAIVLYPLSIAMLYLLAEVLGL